MVSADGSNGDGVDDADHKRNLRRGRAPLWEAQPPPGRCGSFGNGDLVWAKAFPYTWWPGWVRRSKGALRLVSFFGGGRSMWLDEAGVRGFEENYVLMSKMAGARLARQVDCALSELGRRTGLGTACGCRGPVGGADEHLVSQIGRERDGFEPAEILGFVLGLAVCAWVGDAETICAVRVAAQVSAYRAHVLVERRAEVSGGFQPKQALDAVRRLAVSSAWVDDGVAGGMDRVVAQVDAYRRFVAVCPGWVYRSPAEDSSGLVQCSTDEDSEGSDLEMPFISLSEMEEADDPDSLYEDEREEQDEEDSMMQEKVQPDDEFCTFNRIDYSIFSSDSEFEHLSDNEMENVHNWSEEEVAFDAEKAYDVSTLNEDSHNQICNLICGLLSADSGQELSLGRETSERDRDNEFNVVREVELLPKVDLDKSSIPIHSANINTNVLNNSCRYASCLDRFHGKEFNESVVPDSLVEKATDFSLTDASSSLKFTTENSSQIVVGSSFGGQPSMEARMFRGEEGGLQVLHEMLYRLYCLASDPLFMRSESSMSFCHLVLRYRASTLQNISSLPSMILTKETQKAQALDVWGHHHLTNGSGKNCQDDKVADMCEHSSIEGVLFHRYDDGIELDSSAECHSNLHTPHATRDSIVIDCRTDNSTASKTVDEKYNAGIRLQFNAERGLSGKIVVDKTYAAANGEVAKAVSNLTSPVSCDQEVATRKRRFDQEVTSATSSNLHAGNWLGSDVQAPRMSTTVLDNKRSNDTKAFYGKLCDMNDVTKLLFHDNAGYDAARVWSSSNFLAAANMSGNNTESRAVASSSALPPSHRYEASLCRKRKLDQPVHSYISKWQKKSLFIEATQLYASPLVRDSSNATHRAQCSPVIGRKAGPSNSLHMKFPRGFNLPSKEDLERIFGVFGPLDCSGTRVFFYTGAGKVVFLNPVDAETAYSYVRRNRIFETDMRFWLDAHEKLRKAYSTQTLSLSQGQMPALNLKSCLKRSSALKNEDMKKKCRVRFSI